MNDLTIRAKDFAEPYSALPLVLLYVVILVLAVALSTSSVELVCAAVNPVSEPQDRTENS